MLLYEIVTGLSSPQGTLRNHSCNYTLVTGGNAYDISNSIISRDYNYEGLNSVYSRDYVRSVCLFVLLSGFIFMRPYICVALAIIDT